MPDIETPPAPPPAPKPPAPPPTPPAPPPTPPPAPKPPKGEIDFAPPSLTMEQVQELLDKRLTQERSTWEAEALPRLKAEIKAPIELDADINGMQREFDSSGQFIPADTDNSNPAHPGLLSFLRLMDNTKVVCEVMQNGKTQRLTQYDIARNVIRGIISQREKKPLSKDQLGTPPVQAGDSNYFDQLRKQTAEQEAAARDARKSGLARVFNMTGTR